MSDRVIEPLPRAEVVKAVERRCPWRVPLVMARWWGEGLWEQYGERLTELDVYPTDAPLLMINPLDVAAMQLPWLRGASQEKRGHDAGGLLPDWRYLDEFLNLLPGDASPAALEPLLPSALQVRERDQYMLWGFWGLFFERPWGLRGMEGLLSDYHLHPNEVHRLHDALCDIYVRWIHLAARQLRPDGFWTSDDLGHQTQCMMRPSHFREFLKPYYRRVARACHDCGMHFWLHSCGNNTDLLADLQEAGVDVFHPVQKHTMDERAVAAAYGDRMTFLVGFDVQHVLQEGTPLDVRLEVRHLIDTFDRPDGGMCMAAGNGIVAGTPFANIDAFLDESIRYGRGHRARWAVNA